MDFYEEMRKIVKCKILESFTLHTILKNENNCINAYYLGFIGILRKKLLGGTQHTNEFIKEVRMLPMHTFVKRRIHNFFCLYQIGVLQKSRKQVSNSCC